MREDNIFIAGGAVTGESFFGRSDQLTELERDFCRGTAHRSLSVVGPNKIGKSSLFNRFIERHLKKLPNTVIVELSMEAYANVSNFLEELSQRLHQKISEKMSEGLISDDVLKTRLQTLIDEWDKCRTIYHYSEPPTFKHLFENVLERLCELSWQTFLIIDEFDNAETLFNACNGNFNYYGLVRDFGNRPSHGVTCILISRRRLYRIERLSDENKHNSTFHGAFDDYLLGCFNDADIEDFWGGLSNYEIHPGVPGLQEQLNYYAGAHPYLLSLWS